MYARVVLRSILCLAVAFAVGPSLALAAKPAGKERPAKKQAVAKKPAPKYGRYNPDDPSVELFAALKAGQIEVKFIPRNEEQARLFVTNKTDKPLNVKLPEAFAARPALAQFQPGGGGGNMPGGQQGQGQGNGQGGGQNQAVGGGGGRGQNGGNGNGMLNNQGGGPNLFNVAPEKTVTVKLGVLCLEHGKPNPRAAIPYEIVPIDEITSDKAVHALIAQFANDEIDHKVAQAAVWHQTDNLTWDQLANKMLYRATGMRQPYYAKAELNAAKQALEDVEKALASETEPTASDSARAAVQRDESSLQKDAHSSFGVTSRPRE
jgi:hypothetical protein